MEIFIKWYIFSHVKFILLFLFKKCIYVLLEILEKDKILVISISYKIELVFVHVFNLVYVVENIVKWKLNSNVWWSLKHCNVWWSFILYQKNRTNRSNPNRIGLVRILFLKSTEPNRMFFYLAIWMTFTLKTEPNRTNTPTHRVQVCSI